MAVLTTNRTKGLLYVKNEWRAQIKKNDVLSPPGCGGL